MLDSSITLDMAAKIFAADYAGHLFRYFLIAGGVFLLFYVWLRRRMQRLKIQRDYPATKEMRREVLYSLVSIAIFAGVGVLTFVMYRAGWTRVYLDAGRFGWGYVALSTAALILAHDAWFYWTHRLMHVKALFPIVHRIHHLSHNPTPWAAFAFHPIEALIQAIFFPVVAMLLPLHPLAPLLWLIYMTGMNVLGHCGFEFLPKGFTRNSATRWHNTSLHHNMHHRYVHCNYSLYFNIWDRLMGTNHARYDEEFDQMKQQREATTSAFAKPAR